MKKSFLGILAVGAIVGGGLALMQFGEPLGGPFVASTCLTSTSTVTTSLEASVKTDDFKEKKADRIAQSIPCLTKASSTDGSVELVSVSTSSGKLVVYARAWDSTDQQVGFGKDGSVDQERFVITNPPVLVPDPLGPIIRSSTVDGVYIEHRYREDAKAALLSVINDVAFLNGRTGNSKNIFPGKKGNTTLVIYGVASSTEDGLVERAAGTETWSVITGGTGGYSSPTQTGEYYLAYQNIVASTPTFNDHGRFIMSFDTSAIGAGTIASATLSIFGGASLQFNETGSGDLTANIYQGRLGSLNSVIPSDYQRNGTSTASTAFSTGITQANWAQGGYNHFKLNATGIAAIQPASSTVFSLKSEDDANTVTPAAGDGSGRVTLSGFHVDKTGTSQDPRLIVELTCNPSVTTCVDTYLVSSTITWVAPTNVNSVHVACWGGGGGGFDGTTSGGGAGGGGGAFASGTVVVTPSSGYTLIIGRGGPEGTNGATSSFNGTSIVASPGRGGTNATTGQGIGGASSTSVGTQKAGGGRGGSGLGNDDAGGGGGGAGGPQGEGGNGVNATTTAGGAGGAGSAGSGGAGGAGGNGGECNAGAYSANGGGGGGGADNNLYGCGGGSFGGGGGGGENNGGRGADGACVLTYTASAGAVPTRRRYYPSGIIQ